MNANLRPVLLALAASLAPLWAAGEAAAAESQPLAIVIHGDGARATQLPSYDVGEPIAVSVTESSGQHLDAVTAVAAGPQGESVRTPLTRLPNGTFGGMLALQDVGAWRVRISSRAGSATIDTIPVTLALEAPPPSNAWQIGLGVGIAIFVVIGGAGFWVLRNTIAAPPARTLRTD